MNEAFFSCWVKTGRAEQGYANNPNDAGGETNWGITKAVAFAYGYTGPMKDLPKETAQNIAKQKYWDPLKLDAVAEISLSVANEVFDTGFLCGILTSGNFLQRCLNTFNRQQKDYQDILENGTVKDDTVAALKGLIAKRGTQGELVLLRALNCMQGNYLINISKSRPQNEEFEFGWFLNRVVV